MTLNKVVNSITITATVAFLTVMALHVNTGATSNSIAVLKTSGMTCGSCSNTITKALERLDGVATTEVDIEGGWVIVGYDTKAVKPETLATKVKETGFDCTVHQVLTPEQFKQATGREIGKKALPAGDCGGCGTNSGSGTSKQKLSSP